MPVKISSANIFETGANVIVNPVNCVGVMGKGLALEFKNKFPGNFKTYETCCQSNQLKPGGILITKAQLDGKPIYIANIATKDHWKQPSNINHIKRAVITLRSRLHAHRDATHTSSQQHTSIKHVAMPALGAGLGGLNWDDVRTLIEQTFDNDDDFLIELIEPKETTLIEGKTQ